MTLTLNAHDATVVAILLRMQRARCEYNCVDRVYLDAQLKDNGYKPLPSRALSALVRDVADELESTTPQQQEAPVCPRCGHPLDVNRDEYLRLRGYICVDCGWNDDEY